MCHVETSHQRLDLSLVPKKLGLHLAFMLLHVQNFLMHFVELLLHRVHRGDMFSFQLLCSCKVCDKLLVCESKLLALLPGEVSLFLMV
jgi:hypothetical protein